MGEPGKRGGSYGDCESFPPLFAEGHMSDDIKKIELASTEDQEEEKYLTSHFVKKEASRKREGEEESGPAKEAR